MLSRDDCDPLRWQEERVLRQQLRGRFRDVCEAVAELRKKTIRASSLVENLNSRLGGRPRISPTPALDLFFPILIDRSPCV